MEAQAQNARWAASIYKYVGSLRWSLNVLWHPANGRAGLRRRRKALFGGSGVSWPARFERQWHKSNIIEGLYKILPWLRIQFWVFNHIIIITKYPCSIRFQRARKLSCMGEFPSRKTIVGLCNWLFQRIKDDSETKVPMKNNILWKWADSLMTSSTAVEEEVKPAKFHKIRCGASWRT